MSRIEMVDLAGRHASVASGVERRVLEVLRSGRYIGGPVVREAEARVATWFGREAAVGVASGTDALILGLQALGVGAGDEVIVPALSFFATAGAVSAVGAKPVVVDVAANALMDSEAAAAAVTPRTRAVIPVHLFGNPAPALDLGVAVLDDAAQAVGAGPSASVGVLSAVSAYPTKTWGAAGDGGFVVGERDAVELVRRLGNHGSGSAGTYERVAGSVGRNSRLDALQAAVLMGHADTLEERVERRRELARRYDANLPDSVRPLPRSAAGSVQVYAAVTADRAGAIAALSAAGIAWQIYYDRPLSAQPAIEGSAPTPVADLLATQLIALPIHAGLTEADVDRVCRALRPS